MQTHATVADFVRWAEVAEDLDDAELLHAVRDAFEAAAAMEDHAPVAAGRYRDEAMTYEQELGRRRRPVAC